MPLSEEELRMLEQMERALVEEDPKFASTLRGTSMRRAARRRAVVAGVAFVVGIAVMMTGVVASIAAVGIIGFVIMLASATVGVSAVRGQQAAAEGARTAHGFTVHDGGRSGGRSRRRGGAQQRRGSLTERMEARWRRRREQGGF